MPCEKLWPDLVNIFHVIWTCTVMRFELWAWYTCTVCEIVFDVTWWDVLSKGKHPRHQHTVEYQTNMFILPLARDHLSIKTTKRGGLFREVPLHVCFLLWAETLFSMIYDLHREWPLGCLYMIKMLSYQNRYFHYKDKMVSAQPYLFIRGNTVPVKTVFIL